MAKNKGTRILITLECTECRSNLNKRSPGVSRYSTQKNRRNNPESPGLDVDQRVQPVSTFCDTKACQEDCLSIAAHPYLRKEFSRTKEEFGGFQKSRAMIDVDSNSKEQMCLDS